MRLFRKKERIQPIDLGPVPPLSPEQKSAILQEALNDSEEMKIDVIAEISKSRRKLQLLDKQIGKIKTALEKLDKDY